MSPFDQAFNYLLTKEGYTYTDDPDDNGGPTRYGITKATLERYLKRACTAEEVAFLDLSTAKLIYEEYYWMQINCHKMSKTGIAIALFSSAALYGTTKTAQMTQKALNICGASLKVDGHLGDKSIAVLNIVKQDEFFKAFHGQLIERIEDIVAKNPKQKKFENGWKNRANALFDLRFVNTTIV